MDHLPFDVIISELRIVGIYSGIQSTLMLAYYFIYGSDVTHSSSLLVSMAFCSFCSVVYQDFTAKEAVPAATTIISNFARLLINITLHFLTNFSHYFCDIRRTSDNQIDALFCNPAWPQKILFFILININLVTFVRVVFLSIDLFFQLVTWAWAAIRAL